MFATAPHSGDFWWPEAPRNALDGVFFLDFLQQLPLHDPKGWALDYYNQYPALTVLFYPPLMHLVLAFVYAVFGISHAAAVGTTTGFLFVLLLATFHLARPLVGQSAALCAAILLAAAPECLVWAQQVMLDVPEIALSTTAAVFLRRYGDTARSRYLVIFAALGVATLYTKQTGLVSLAALFAGLLLWRGASVLRRAHVWLIGGAAILALIPLMFLQVRFASFNFALVKGIPELNGSQPDLFATLVWYLARLPEMAGWPTCILAAAGLGAVVVRRERGPMLLMLSWLLIGYIGLTLIAEKETRHGLPLLPPLVILAAQGLQALTGTPRLASRLGRNAGATWIGFAVVVFAWTLASDPTPVVTGVRAAADEVVRQMPGGGRVLFSGRKDGAFIFDVRTLDPGRRISVVRADKLFLNINIQPELGLNARDIDRETISRLMDEYAISYVVSTPGLWTEAAVMRNFEAVLGSNQFEQVGTVPMVGPVVEKQLRLYRNTHALAASPTGLDFALMGGSVAK